MPITYTTKLPTDPSLAHSAAQIGLILIDRRSRRVLIEVDYGTLVNGEFVRNRHVPSRTYGFDGSEFAALAATIPPLPAQGMYANVKKVAWDLLIARGYEAGTQV